uniref:hypothetical protein orf264 n=1 Tax=Tayloriella tenebrosa TaxID=1917049 RepID=UPI0022FD7545|nr:hypothetical protein orf264 [Tayloriella tenebrosa]WAX03663.1 hypothetical protein orf264 [Tayloriella tenebrosa]
MNFLRYISSQDYIHLDLKFSYKKHIYLKRLVALIAIITLPYISNITSIIVMLLIQITVIVIFQNLYLMKLFSLYKKVLFVSLNTIFFNHFINYSQYNNISISYISILYSFKIISLFYVKKFICKFNVYYIIYIVPEYIKKMIVLNTLYIIIYNNISIFFKTETISKTLYIGYKYISNLQINLYNIMIINILISNQILEKTIEKIHSSYLGIKIKSKANKRELMKYIIFYNTRLFDKILKDQNNLNITLWTRSINNKFNNKIYID